MKKQFSDLYLELSQFNSGIRTWHWKEVYRLLTGIEHKIGQGDSERVEHISVYNPSDHCAIYEITNKLSDQELEFVNKARSYYGYKALPRLSRTKSGYQSVINKAQQEILEHNQFADITPVSEYDDSGYTDPRADIYLKQLLCEVKPRMYENII